MTRPCPTQENLWLENSFLEASPQWRNPCSSVCQEDRGGGTFLRVTLLTRHPQKADGKGRQGCAIMQTPTLRNRVRVQKWIHPMDPAN